MHTDLEVLKWIDRIKAEDILLTEQHGEFHPNKLHLGVGEITLPNDPKVYYVKASTCQEYYESLYNTELDWGFIKR